MIRGVTIALLIFITKFSFSQELEVHNQFSSFYSYSEGPFIETSFVILANRLSYHIIEENKLQAKIGVTEIFKQHDSIVSFKKYELLGPEIKDSVFLDFMNQERFGLSEGFYNYEIHILDLYSNDSSSFDLTRVVKLIQPDTNIVLSSMELIQPKPTPTVTTTKFSKAGFEIIPLVYDYYPVGANILTFYTEIYNSQVALGENESYLASWHLEDFNTSKLVGSYSGFAKLQTKPENVLIKSFDISELLTGTYVLVLDIKNRSNELLNTKQHRFYRMNNQLPNSNITNIDIAGTFAEKITNKDTITEYIRSLHPVASELERNIIDNQIESYELVYKQQFLYAFWVSRKADNPEYAWENYKKQVAIVERMFHTHVKKGYETDRGRVYLKYGTPNTVSDNPNEPSAYPYQIWHYYKAGPYSNRKFIFYDRDLVSNDYQLLHSDVPGEIQNKNWNLIINSRNNPSNNIDDTNGQQQYGGNSEDYWTVPH